MENRKTIDNINKAKSWLLEIINKIGKLVGRLIKKKREKGQIIKISNERGDITINITEIKIKGKY